VDCAGETGSDERTLAIGERRIFTERFDDDIIKPWARRTARVDQIVHCLALALGIGATVFVRSRDGRSAHILKDNDTLDMPEIGLAVPLAEFCEGLEFADDPVEDNDRQSPATA
jgi:hypothetical protein